MLKKLPKARLPAGRWQKEQKVRRRRKTRYAIFGTLAVIFLLIVGGFGWKIYGSVSKSVWDGENQLNLVLNSSPVLVASFNPPEKSINVLVIPEGTFIEVIQGFGPYRVESIYGLGELSGRGGELLAGSIQEYLGIPVDAWIGKWDNELGDGIKIKELLDKIFLNLIKKDDKTNLTRWDLVRLWWFVKGIRQDKMTRVDLGQTTASEEVILPDGSKALKIDPERGERIVGQLFGDEKIREEGLTIAILNGTDHPGLANKGARLVRNIGGRVVGMGDWEVGSEKWEVGRCEVRSGKKYKNTYTVQKLLKVFDCQWAGENLENQRAEVVLILGER